MRFTGYLGSGRKKIAGDTLDKEIISPPLIPLLLFINLILCSESCNKHTFTLGHGPLSPVANARRLANY